MRGLAVELTLLPVEGGARVAIVRDAQRMNDDAQSALLKTLEEPPAGTTLILCADDEERLLPTVRSRCARIRLGAVGTRDIERLLDERGLADAPTAARLARLAGGRAGIAVAYASAPEAERLRGEIGRILIDLLGAGRAARLRAASELVARAGLAGRDAVAAGRAVTAATGRRGKGASAKAGGAAPAATTATADDPAGIEPGPDADAAADAGSSRKVPAAERRRAVRLLLDAWRVLTRDLALARRARSARCGTSGCSRSWRPPRPPRRPAPSRPSSRRLTRAGELVDGNVSPELVLDVLLVRWPAVGPRP